MKPLSEISKPDDRQDLFNTTLEEIHEELRGVTMNPQVPAPVRELFETAKNLSLHSWFVYEFHPIAELTGFLALEQALRARAKREGPTLAKKNLRTIMNHAIDTGWFTEEGFEGRQEIATARVRDRKALEAIERMNQSGVDSEPVEEPTEDEVLSEAKDMKIVKSVCDSAVSLRNSLAHGNNYLMPHSHRRLHMTANLINQLFS